MRLKKLNTGISSKINRSTVLTLIHQFPLISRAQIAERTGLDRSTITHILNYLLQDGLVEEVEKGKASARGGRCPMQLRVCYDRKSLIAIDIGIQKITAVLTNLSGKEIKRVETFIKPGDPLLDRLIEILEQLKRRREQFDNVVVMGMSCPGVIDAELGRLKHNIYHQWKDIPVAETIGRHFGKPVFLENDANCATKGELSAYADEGIGSLLYLIIREAPIESSYLMGVGGGMIFDNHLWRGTHGFAGEISYAVNARVSKLFSAGVVPQDESGKRILLGAYLNAAAAGQEEAIRVVKGISDSLGNLLSELASLADPDSVMIHFGVSEDNDYIAKATQEAFFHWHIINGNSPVRFLKPKCGKEAVLRGVLALAQERVFVNDTSQASLLFV